VARLETEVGRLRAAMPADPEDSTMSAAVATGSASAADGAAAWEERVRELRFRRDRLAEQKAASDAIRQEAEGRRARAEAAVALDEERIVHADREEAALVAHITESTGERNALRTVLTVAVEHEARARAELEARLGVDALREQLLVELAGLGELGIQRLREVGGVEAIPIALDSVDDGEGAAFERVLDLIAPRWAATPPIEVAPPAGRLAYLRRRFHELGAANPFAVEEYAELRERLESLETQETDLRSAIESTRSLIGELNALIGDQFRTTFRALEAAFDRRFNQLFGGGYARLSLTDPGDLSQTGVEIVARPPGKKAQGLAMLSGGERALTAVALLFAMLEVRPVPFCVLDEVDAALDEANVGRFSTALRGLADETQFIVITHNRGTIEIADALYGVTVGEDSISRVISLRLEEAHAIAERQAALSDDRSSETATIG
jgi:chromosome segregation protein